ncbi:hypothetical protein [Brevundimonas sp.]|uniref:hypothetical protein n=1 Tax=Brevundimonas sp. TaxID=1871086 RepID=UPI002D5DD80E|nr:hypothetical protein [Brevundimonas sp.]HYC98015.1 hypothetical protein [Brevundimonas sp.]
MSKGLKQVALYSLLGFVGLILVTFAVGWVAGYQKARGAAIDVDQFLFWTMAAVAVVSMIGGMAISVAWMRSIDEAAREAHKSAWFWGGCGGMAVGGVFIILASIPQAAAVEIPTWFEGRTDPVAYAATGAGALALLMVAGYTLAWAWWWWKRR